MTVIPKSRKRVAACCRETLGLKWMGKCSKIKNPKSKRMICLLKKFGIRRTVDIYPINSLSLAKVTSDTCCIIRVNGPFTAVHDYAKSSKIKFEKLVPSTLLSPFYPLTKDKCLSSPHSEPFIFFPLVNVFIHLASK